MCVGEGWTKREKVRSFIITSTRVTNMALARLMCVPRGMVQREKKLLPD